MALPRSAVLLLGLLAAAAAGGAGWVLLREEPAAPVDPGTGTGRTPTFEGGGGRIPDGPGAARGRTDPDPDPDPDDDRDLDRPAEGPEGGADVEEVLAAAARGDWLEVERLLSAGGGTADPRVTKALLLGLQDDRWRNRVADIARYLKDPAALSLFLEVAKGEGNPMVRAAALSACAAMGGPGVLEAAGDLLRSEKPGSILGGAAALALGKLGTPEAARQLTDLLRQRAGGPHAAALVQALSEVRSPEALAAVGEMAMDDANDPEFRAALVRALGQTREPGVLNDLLRASRDQEDEGIRGAAYQALALVGTAEAIQELVTVLQGADNQRRHEAALALGGTSSKAAGPLLEEALGGALDPVLKAYVVTALGRTGSKSSVEVLGRIAADAAEDGNLRGTAARSLGQIGDPSAAPILVKLLQDAPATEASLRSQVLGALRSTATAAELPALERMLEGTKQESSEWFVLKSLVEQLRRGGAPLRPLQSK